MATEKDLSTAITHVRLIHFTLIIVCIIVLYIVLFAWSDVQLVRGELEKLKRIAEEFASETLPARWERERVESHLKTLERSLGVLTPMNRTNQQQIDMAKQFDRDFLLRDTTGDWLKPTDNMANWRTNLEGLSGLVIKEVIFDPQDVQWAKEKSTDKFYGLGGQLINVVRIVRISPAATEGELDIELSADSQHFVKGNPTVISSHETKLIKCHIRTEREPIAASGWFLKAHPRLCTAKRWTVLGDKSIQDAIKSVDNELSGALKTTKPTLIGMEFRGEDIGWVGPLAILAVMSYLLAFLQHIGHRIRSIPDSNSARGGLFAEWIGAMPERLPRIMTCGSIAVLPAATASLAVYVVFSPSALQLYGASAILVSVALFTFYSFVGYLCCIACRELPKQYGQGAP